MPCRCWPQETHLTRWEITLHVITICLLIVAASCFALAAFGVPSRVAWVPLGLLAWVLVPLIAALR